VEGRDYDTELLFCACAYTTSDSQMLATAVTASRWTAPIWRPSF